MIKDTVLKEAWDILYNQACRYNNIGLSASEKSHIIEGVNRSSPLPFDAKTTLAIIDLADVYQTAKETAWEEFCETKTPRVANPMDDAIVPWGTFSQGVKPAPPSFVDIFLRPGSLHLVHAASGAGKTPFSMLLVAAAMTGRKFLQFEIGEQRAEKVWYLDGELPQWLLLERIESCFRTVPDKGGLFVYSMSDAYDKGRPLIDLTGNIGREQFLSSVRENKPDIIVMDNRTDFYHGRESVNDDAADFNEFLKQLRSLGPATIINHHSNKDGGYRGASSIIGPMDYVFNLATKEDTDNAITVKTEKNRFGIPKVGTTQHYTPVFTKEYTTFTPA